MNDGTRLQFSGRRALAIARRVVRQLGRDRRTVILLVTAPMLVLTLAALLMRADPAVIPLGIVNQDQGVMSLLNLGDEITARLLEDPDLSVIALEQEQIDAQLRAGTVQAVLVFPDNLSQDMTRAGAATVDLRLEGSMPSRSMIITGRVTQLVVRTLAELAAAQLGTQADMDRMPVTVNTSYLYTGAEFDILDYSAPVYIALLAIFLVFLLTCVSFQRERSHGTMERLLATPTTRLELVLGYLLGLGLFALVQVSVITLFTVYVLRIHHLGSLALMLLTVVLLALVGVSLGILASAFARNEFQVIQFIPILIIPQALLSGTVWPVEEMPAWLQPVAYVMPLTYANWALRDVMLKGWGLAEIWPYLALLVGFTGLLIALGALTMQQEVA